MFITDGANTGTRRFTHGPRAQSLLVRVFKHVLSVTAHLHQRDLWLHSHHTSQTTDAL